MGWKARQDWRRRQLSAPPTLLTMMLMMCEVNHGQIVNSVTESYAKNETMMWLGGTGNSVSCSSPSTLSVLCMMETNANSVNVNTPSAKYVLLAVNKRILLMKD